MGSAMGSFWFVGKAPMANSYQLQSGAIIGVANIFGKNLFRFRGCTNRRRFSKTQCTAPGTLSYCRRSFASLEHKHGLYPLRTLSRGNVTDCSARAGRNAHSEHWSPPTAHRHGNGDLTLRGVNVPRVSGALLSLKVGIIAASYIFHRSPCPSRRSRIFAARPLAQRFS